MTLRLTVITFIHCVPVPMSPPTTCWAFNAVSTSMWRVQAGTADPGHWPAKTCSVGHGRDSERAGEQAAPARRAGTPLPRPQHSGPAAAAAPRGYHHRPTATRPIRNHVDSFGTAWRRHCQRIIFVALAEERSHHLQKERLLSFGNVGSVSPGNVGSVSFGNVVSLSETGLACRHRRQPRAALLAAGSAREALLALAASSQAKTLLKQGLSPVSWRQALPLMSHSLCNNTGCLSTSDPRYWPPLIKQLLLVAPPL